MKHHILFLTLICCLVSSCEKATPQSYFEQAVLNCNRMHGFAGKGMERRLNEPSVKLADASGTRTVPMTRKEVVEDLTRSIEQAYEKVRKLEETEDTRAMLQASRAIYDYVLPVLRDDYQQLARLHDGGSGAKEIEMLSRSIEMKYLAGFQSRMDALTASAKPYAERNGIPVQWDVRTSPAR